MPLLSADELAAIRDKAETRVRLSTSADPDQTVWRDDQSAATVDDLRGLLGHIDALTAALAAEQVLADDLGTVLTLVPELVTRTADYAHHPRADVQIRRDELARMIDAALARHLPPANHSHRRDDEPTRHPQAARRGRP